MSSTELTDLNIRFEGVINKNRQTDMDKQRNQERLIKENDDLTREYEDLLKKFDAMTNQYKHELDEEVEKNKENERRVKNAKEIEQRQKDTAEQLAEIIKKHRVSSDELTTKKQEKDELSQKIEKQREECELGYASEQKHIENMINEVEEQSKALSEKNIARFKVECTQRCEQGLKELEQSSKVLISEAKIVSEQTVIVENDIIKKTELLGLLKDQLKAYDESYAQWEGENDKLNNYLEKTREKVKEHYNLKNELMKDEEKLQNQISLYRAILEKEEVRIGLPRMEGHRRDKHQLEALGISVSPSPTKKLRKSPPSTSLAIETISVPEKNLSIHNVGSIPILLEGFQLVNECDQSKTFTFTNEQINGGSRITLWWSEANKQYCNPPRDIYLGDAFPITSEGASVILKDKEGTIIDQLTVPIHTESILKSPKAMKPGSLTVTFDIEEDPELKNCLEHEIHQLEGTSTEKPLYEADNLDKPVDAESRKSCNIQ